MTTKSQGTAPSLSHSSTINSSRIWINKMSNIRIIKRQLVYVVGLPYELAYKDELLHSYEYFGQYGKITKLVVNKNKLYNPNGANGPSYSAYITFSTPEEASLAILSLENSIYNNHIIKASYGTTKYCMNFLKSDECYNRDCLYLHYFADDSDVICRDDMSDKSIFLAQQNLAIKIAKILDPAIRQRIISRYKDRPTFLNSPCTIYEKDLVKSMMRENLLSKRVMTITTLFRQRQTSRFDFVDKTKECSNIKIPDYISDLIVSNIYQRDSQGNSMIDKEAWLLDWENFNFGELGQTSKMFEDEEYILLNKFNSR